MHPVLKRFLLSLCVAALTFWMSLESVFLTQREKVASYSLLPSGYTNYRAIPEVKKQIEEFQKEHKRLPKGLHEVEEWAKFEPYERERWANDAWERKLIYQHSDRHFQLISYGHDGKSGGAGLDADLTSAGAIPQPPTFWQFLTYREAGMVRIACIGAALFAFFVAMYASTKDAREGKKASATESLISLAIMVGISVVGAIFMGGLEYPSGH
jgi:hypothetical protein